jgi:predicted nucleotidyltransferase
MSVSKTIQMRSKGSITVPIELRRKYGLEEGDVFSVIDLGDGSFVLAPRVTQVDRLGDQVAQVMKEEGASLDEALTVLEEERERYYPEHHANAVARRGQGEGRETSIVSHLRRRHKDTELLKAKRQEILAIAAKHGARNLRVFGSVARGEGGKRSDIDFLVDMEKGRSLLDRIALWQDLEDLLGCKVDVVSEKALHWYLRDSVIEDATPL